MSQNQQAVHLATAEKATKGIFGPGGYLEQAQKAQAAGAFGDFVNQLIQTLGPIIGAALAAFLQSLIPHVPPVPTPAGK